MQGQKFNQGTSRRGQMERVPLTRACVDEVYGEDLRPLIVMYTRECDVIVE